MLAKPFYATQILNVRNYLIIGKDKIMSNDRMFTKS